MTTHDPLYSKLPKVLLKHTLRLNDHDTSPRTYRIVAVASEFGYGGVDFVVERLKTLDAMRQEVWTPTEPSEGSLIILAIGQSLLVREEKMLQMRKSQISLEKPKSEFVEYKNKPKLRPIPDLDKK